VKLLPQRCVRWSLQAIIAGVLLLFGYATNSQAQTQDSWRSANERVFAFNDYFDRILVRPVATTYTTFVPRIARQGIGNFFSNIDDINVFINDLLQLKFDAALSDSGRFLINSSVGLGGLFDIAYNFGLLKNEEDFGQTFGRWGVSGGNYVVLPVFGASNVRDAFGLVLDTLLNPIQYQDDVSLRLSLFLLEEVDNRASLIPLDELISGDKYLFFREAYVQRRLYLLNDGQIEDEFGEF